MFRNLKSKALNKLASGVRKLLKHAHNAEARSIASELAAFGEHSRINGKIFVSGRDRVHIAENVHIGNNAWINGEGGVHIGENTHISRNLVLYSVNHNYKGKRLPYDEELIKKPVKIGKNVWIGMNVCITPGTTIGDGAIVGMGAVVSGEVEPGAIVVSPRARTVGTRNQAHYEKLEQKEAYGGIGGRPINEKEDS